MIRVLCVITVAYPLVVFAGFTEVPQFGAWRTETIGWGDIDNDGDPDLALATTATSSEDNYFYVNQGDGTFDVLIDEMPYSTYSMVWGDCDNDYDADVAVGCNPSPPSNFIYVNDGSGNFTKRPELGTASQPYCIAWADADLDGDLDVALAAANGTHLYVNDGDGHFEETLFKAMGGVTTLAWGDADNDGDPDLAIGRSSLFQNHLLVNNGTGDFTLTDEFGAGRTSSAVWGDYDNDGDLDLAVANWTPARPSEDDEDKGVNLLYVNLGDNNFLQTREFGRLDSYSIAWADYDNDGDLDAAVGNRGDPNRLYVNDGDGTFTGGNEFGEWKTQSIGWADYDKDGDLDLAVGNFGWGAQDYLYVNNEDDGDYLSIHLVGHYADGGHGYSNSDGVGAKVSVYEAGYVDMNAHLLGFREIEANGGWCGQDSIEAEFGLPDDDTVDVRIVWPGSGGSRITQVLLVDKTQFITVHESIIHLLLPGDGEDVGGFPVTLDWENAFSGGTDPYDANLTDYTIQIATDTDFDDVVFTVNANESQYTLDESSGLEDGTYYWRVLANYADTPGDYAQYSADKRSFNLGNVGIALNYFDAASENDGVELRWEVNETGETALAGFNLYRAVRSGGTDAKAITSRGRLNAELITGESPYEYLDTAVEKGETYNYWLEALVAGGSSETFGPVECTWRGALPTAYALYQSRPNPAPGTATIAFDLPETAPVTLIVYDINGRKVTTVVNETLTAGEHEAEVSGLAPGVYVYRLEAGDFNAARKMVIIGSDL